MKVWPFGVAGRAEASNHHMLRWLKTVVVSDVEKAHVMRQVGSRETTAVLRVEILKATSEPGRMCVFRDEPGGYPFTGQAVSGAEAA